MTSDSHLIGPELEHHVAPMTESLIIDRSDVHDAPAAEVVAAEQGRPGSLGRRAKVAYAMGGTAGIFGHYLYNALAGPVYNVFLGLTPSLVSLTRGCALLVDAGSGLFFGWLSDNTRSRWGRRRPYVLFGSIFVGLGLPCLFMGRPDWSQGQIFWFMMISAVLFAPFIALCETAYQSLGAELTPDHHERTSVMAYKGVVQKIAGTLISGALWFSTRPVFNNPQTGQPDIARGAMWAAAIAGALVVLTGIANFLFVNERYYGKAKLQARVTFTSMFTDALRCRPYLILLGVMLVYTIPTGLAGSLGFYVLTYYVFRGDVAGASEVTFYNGVAFTLMGLVGIAAVGKFSQRLGKQNALTAALLVSVVAFGATWWLLTPRCPWLAIIPGALNGFSNTALWVVLPSMTADVVDYDELQSGKRREGIYHATSGSMIRVGMMFSMLISGPLLELTGFDAKLGGNQQTNAVLGIRCIFATIPVVAIVIALLLIHLYPLSTERMSLIRRELEGRRGGV
jgi:GPH family glycoside/pentoside/hexuronide:cation symporter